VTLNVNVFAGFLGVPDNVPADDSKRPPGSDPDDTEKV